MISSHSRSRVRVLSFLSTLVLLTLAGPAIAANSEPDDISQKTRTQTKVTAFPDKPADVGAQSWARLQATVEEAKLLPRPNGIAIAHGQFGYSVSVDGARALVGGHRLAASGAALVLVDTGSGWQEDAVLVPADGETWDKFGVSVSLSGDRALVGAYLDDDNGTDSGSAYVFDFNGTTWSETAKLKAADGESGDQFGISVNVAGDRALVGAHADDDNGLGSGSAYVFDFNGTAWSETAKLTPADGAGGDYFGYSLSLSGDRALVGAHHHGGYDFNSGSAYVFDFDGSNWSEMAKLMPAESSGYVRFGYSVSLFGDRALVGASLDDDNGTNSGSAYVFDFNGTGWSETVKITPADGAPNDHFGTSVSLSGDRALVGARLDDDNGTNSGSAYVFDFDGSNWSEMAKLMPAEGSAYDRFGYSVSLSGDRALVGAYEDDDNGTDSGSAYVFDFDGSSWSETAKLTPAEGAGYAYFGYSVSLSGDRALVGAHSDDDNGSAYVFDFDGLSWSETAKLTPADGSWEDWFGTSVSLSGNRALVGAYQDDDNGTDSGSAYVFEFDGSSWNETAKLTPADGARFDYFGASVSLSNDHALVGTYQDFGDQPGSAYVFDFDGSTWSETAKLTPGDGAPYDYFGSSVSLSGDRALIGADWDDDNGDRSGSAYVFDFDGSGWNETAKLTPADGTADDLFGWSVSLSGDRALVGAYRDGYNGFNSGSAYVFDFNGTSWSETVKITPADGAPYDHFGTSVSLSGDRALVGAHLDGDSGIQSGSAYVFRDNHPPIAQPDGVTTDDDTTFNGNVRFNNGNGVDQDADGDPLSVTEVNGAAGDVGAQITLASGALLTISASGDFTYDPNGQFESLDPGDTATDSFDYTISDGFASDSATVTVTINGVSRIFWDSFGN